MSQTPPAVHKRVLIQYTTTKKLTPLKPVPRITPGKHEESDNPIEQLHNHVETFLQEHTIGELYSEKKTVITVDRSDTIEHVLQIMSLHNILSCPVIDPAIDISSDEHFIGIVNLVDIVSAIVFQPIFSRFETEETVSKVSEEQLKQLQNLSIFQMPVEDLLGLSDESKSFTRFIYLSTDPLDKLVQAFSAGLHRVIVRHVDDGTCCQAMHLPIGFYSQTDVVRFLYCHGRCGDMAKLTSKSIQALKMLKTTEDDSSPIKTIAYKATALAGFRKMLLNNELTALPVTDIKGRITATLSLSDLRGITHDGFPIVLLPIYEFLPKVYKRDPQPVTCKPSDSLYIVMAKVLRNHVHRAWLVADDDRPVDVITLTDIIRVFSPYARDLRDTAQYSVYV